MTWVVGGTTLFGYGVAISDIRVTFQKADGEITYIDCLQKVYPVGNFLVAGFAGSVRVGFELIEDMRRFLSPNPPDMSWIPEWVAVNWRRRGRKIFSMAPLNEQKLSSSILLVGIHPTHNLGDGRSPKGVACVFKSPEFEPEFYEVNKFVSIGSGTEVEQYKKRLHDSTQIFDNSAIMMEAGRRGGWGYTIGDHLKMTLKKHREVTVSEHVQTFIVERGKMYISNNETTAITAKGHVKFEMPPLAKSYGEFVELGEREKVSTSLASC
ncbi:MAG: hypothetical protein WA162_07565 [Thermodesulfobacteriota bacterium]